MQGRPALSQNELTWVTNCLDAELKAIQLAEEFAQASDDPDVRTLCQDLSSTHRQHYNTLLKQLKQHGTLQ